MQRQRRLVGLLGRWLDSGGRHDGDRLRRVIGIEDDLQTLIRVRRFARDRRHDDHFVDTWREDGLKATRQAGADRTQRRLLAPTIEALGDLGFRRVHFGGGVLNRLEVSVSWHETIIAGLSSQGAQRFAERQVAVGR